MEIITIKDSLDIKYPLPQEIAEHPQIYYHCTFSCYTNEIEKNGLNSSQYKYNLKYFKFLKHYYDLFDFFYINWQIDNNFHWINYSRKASYVSKDYWFARHYGNKMGGESLCDYLEVCEFLLPYISSPEKMEELNNTINSGDRGNINIAYRQKVIDKRKYYENSQKITENYELIKKMIVGCFPVIYSFNLAEYFARYGECQTNGLNNTLIWNTIDPKYFLYRIDFPTGIVPYEFNNNGQPKAYDWIWDEFLKGFNQRLKKEKLSLYKSKRTDEKIAQKYRTNP